MSVDPEYKGAENLEIMAEAENYNRYLSSIIRRNLPPSGHVLDFGAGIGQFAVPLAQSGVTVTALEPDILLRGKIIGQGVQAVSDLREIKDGSLDYIYTINVLEHIENDVETLRHLHRKLRARGTLLVYVPAFPILYTAMDVKVGHVRRYTRKTLATAISLAGFNIQDLTHVDSLGFFATLGFKYFGDQSGIINRRALWGYDRIIFPISKIVDAMVGRWIGKNLLTIARK